MDANQNSSTDNYSLSSLLYVVSKSLERAGYYGLRGILIIYMISESLQMEQHEAYALYGWFATLVTITPIIGGVLGDLLIGNKWTAVIGGIIQALGAFALCIPSMTMLYVGIGLMSLGAGLYIPNLLSNFGKTQLKRKRLMDSGFTLLYTAINVGAFVGALLIGFLGDRGFTYGFIGSGVLLLLSAFLIIITPDKIDSTETEKETSEDNTIANKSQKNWILIVAAVLLSTMFWGLYELGSGFKFNVVAQLSYLWVDIFSPNLMYQIPQYMVIVFGIIAVLVWYVTHINRFIKISAGFVLGAMSFALMIFIPENSSIILAVLFIISGLFIGIAELLIAPTVNSIITLNANPKYLAIIFALVFLPFRAVNFIVSIIAEASYEIPKLGMGITSVLLLIIGIGTFAVYAVTKQSGTNESAQ